MKKYAILGVPTSLGASIRGAENGPKAIRKFLKQTSKERIKDFGDNITTTCPVGDYHKKRFACIKTNNEKTAAKIKAILRKGFFPITLGGDHSITIGAVSGVAQYYKNIGLIYIDAHGDFNTPKTSPSGNVHGMVLSELTCGNHCGLSKKNIIVEEKNIVLIGTRDLDPEEQKRLEKSKIKVFSRKQVKEQGIEEIMKKALRIVQKNTKGFYVSLDVDGLSPRIAPGTGYRVPNGITKKELFYVLKEIKKQKILGFDIVEVNPKRDVKNKTAKLASEIIQTITK